MERLEKSKERKLGTKRTPRREKCRSNKINP
jgi:hypothetical protein